MKEHVQRLLDSFREIITTSDLKAKAKSDRLVLAETDADKIANLFKRIFNLECPASMQPGLLLPDMVSVSWQYNKDVSGEIQLSNFITSMDRVLDASLMDWILDGHQLANMRIADAVTDMAGPLHTLFEVTNEKIAEQLFLFDSRKLRRIELSYTDYLDMVAATRGIIYWQYLFCDERIILTMADVLSAELDFLESRFPAPELDMLRQRLRERSE